MAGDGDVLAADGLLPTEQLTTPRAGPRRRQRRYSVEVSMPAEEPSEASAAPLDNWGKVAESLPPRARRRFSLAVDGDAELDMARAVAMAVEAHASGASTERAPRRRRGSVSDEVLESMGVTPRPDQGSAERAEEPGSGGATNSSLLKKVRDSEEQVSWSRVQQMATGEGYGHAAPLPGWRGYGVLDKSAHTVRGGTVYTLDIKKAGERRSSIFSGSSGYGSKTVSRELYLEPRHLEHTDLMHVPVPAPGGVASVAVEVRADTSTQIAMGLQDIDQARRAREKKAEALRSDRAKWQASQKTRHTAPGWGSGMMRFSRHGAPGGSRVR